MSRRPSCALPRLIGWLLIVTGAIAWAMTTGPLANASTPPDSARWVLPPTQSGSQALSLEALAYIAHSPQARARALARLTQVHLAGGEGPAALEAALRADPAALPGPERVTLLLDRALALSLSGQPGAAVTQLIKLEGDSALSSGQAAELYRLLGRQLLSSDQTLAAKGKALIGLSSLGLPVAARRAREQRLAAAWDSLSPPRLKSERRARRLSMWLPPLGLLYARRPGTYAVNLGLQAAAVGYTAVNVVFANYVTAGTVGVYLMRSFWVGGVGMAEEAVRYDNALALAAHRARLTALIDDAYRLPAEAPVGR